MSDLKAFSWFYHKVKAGDLLIGKDQATVSLVLSPKTDSLVFYSIGKVVVKCQCLYSSLNWTKHE